MPAARITVSGLFKNGIKLHSLSAGSHGGELLLARHGAIS
jgi:hypothetical protein